ncbi:MAG TPA: hypothetical protein VG944_19310, partial [Fimbriimonas sp.]|nr:hypothetical protein [Fimbriimonas sp.]
RIDYGAGFYGYRIADKTGGQVVIWADKTQRVLMRMLNPRKVVTIAPDGSNPDPKVVKNGLQVTVTQSPLVIMGTEEIPVPKPCYDQTISEVMGLLSQASLKHVDLTDAAIALRDSVNGFDRNPGGVMPEMRRLLHKLEAFMGGFSWVELEDSSDTNFSEVIDAPGCSAGRALTLHPMIDSPNGYYAEYDDVTTHNQNDEEVWIAARIAPEQRSNLQVNVSGEAMPITGDPIGLYGAGFGWYHLGTTKALSGAQNVRIQAIGNVQDVAIDAIVFAPSTFRPNGVFPPEANPVPPQKEEKRREKRDRQPSGPKNIVPSPTPPDQGRTNP